MKVKLYWWSRCSSCSVTRKFLLQREREIEERDFFKEPLSQTELEALLKHTTPSEIFSWKSPSVKSLGLTPNELTEGSLITLMLKEPRLIRRPLVLVNDRLVIGADLVALEYVLNTKTHNASSS